MNLEKHTESARAFLLDLATELGSPTDLDRAARILKAVFATLRERLTLEESFDLIASFPIFIKGLYVNDWQPLQFPLKLKSVAEFLTFTKEADRECGKNDFGDDQDTRAAVAATFRTIKKYTTLGEVLDVGAILPPELRDFWVSA